MESHSGSILVKTSVDELAKVLSPLALEVRRNVVDTQISSSGCFILSYQIVGQAWSGILVDMIYYNHQHDICAFPSVAELSTITSCPVVDFSVSDTVGCIGYTLFENGEIIEYFAGSEDDSDLLAESNIPVETYQFCPYPEYEEGDGPLIQKAAFWSRDRTLTAKDIGNIWKFPDQFLRDRDAYEPAIDIRYFLGTYSLKRDQQYEVKNPGTTLVTGYQEVTAVPKFISVDYFRFGT